MAFENAVGASQQGTQYLSTPGVWTGLDAGVAGRVLTSNGTGVAPSFQPSGAGSGALVLIETRTAVAQGTLTFTTGITPTHRNYLLLSSNVTAAFGAGTNFYIQLSSDGGATYISVGYIGAQPGFFLLLGSLADTVCGTSVLSNLTSGSGLAQGVATSFSTVNVGTISSGGTYTAASIVANAFRVTSNGGPVFSGTFSLYGYVP
jgi:hypothetical protein